MLDYVPSIVYEYAFAFSPLNLSWAPNSTNEFKRPIVFRVLKPLASIRKRESIFIVADDRAYLLSLGSVCSGSGSGSDDRERFYGRVYLFTFRQIS